ncbi:MAG: hypothetical protein H6710_03540 [Myxococcales bacterium]|nr:hypothetical protein [Myxococcales bacterium]MCB9702660.1 hypothetical protein [Myxococcales bacterium]
MSEWMGSGHLLHLRWDLDKTYLRTEFDTVKDLIKTYRQKAEDKVAVAGARALLQALLDPHERRQRRVTFVSGSPTQMRAVLTRKLRLDGIEPDVFILKPNLQNVLAGRFRSVRGQVGYKLGALLRTFVGAVKLDEVLFGDDAEQDAFIYSLYADILAGRVDAVQLASILAACKLYRSEVDEIMALHGRIFGSGDAVRRIFIHLEARSPLDRFAPYGARVVPIYNYLQAALVLHQGEIMRGRDIVAVLEAMSQAGYTPERLANSVQDLVRRGVVAVSDVERLAGELGAVEATRGRTVSTFIRRLRSTAADLAHVRRKSPEWLTEINYLGLYHEARFRRQRHRFLGIPLLD